MEVNRDKKKEITNRILRLYEDWLSTKKSSDIKKIRETLSEAKKSGSPFKFGEAIKFMDRDGRALLDIFSNNWNAFASSPPKAKLKLAEQLYKVTPKTKRLNEDIDKTGISVNNFGLSYTPVADGSKSMETYITPDNERDLLIQIRNAATHGNMTIAGELIKNGWGSLSLKDRNDLIEWVNNIGLYHTSDAAVSKGVKMKPMEKRSDLTKDDFAHQFVRTAIENHKM